MPDTKIKTREAIAKDCERLRAAGRKIGYTSGGFDLVHAGHVSYLRQARALCDVLVVGLNSDASVKATKGALRPIIEESDRASVLEAFEFVDFIFIFDDANNNENVKLLKPDFYIKAGDYTKAKLTSAAIVESFGGKVVLIPMTAGRSTSNTIARILERYAHEVPLHVEEVPIPKDPVRALMLDRDGTIIEHVPYLHEAEKVKPIPGVFASLRKAQDAGYRLVVITNQPGIGLGYFTKEDFFKVNSTFLQYAKKEGVRFDKIYYCPHSEAAQCGCRKPKTGMIEQAKRDLNVDLPNSYVLGDMTSDIQAGKSAGCKTVLVATGEGGGDKRHAVVPDIEAGSVADAIEKLLSMAPKGR